jgi:RNA polymerase sigma factor (sigma-70 family)
VNDDGSSDALVTVLRHAYGRVVAALMREFGGARMALIEDGIGQAMLEATVAWRARGAPPNPRAWLHRAARHRVIDDLRRQRVLFDIPEAPVGETTATLAGEVADDELRALYACAHPDIPQASQLVFALRTLAGFSTREIAVRLVTTEENVQKRYERAREALRHIDLGPADLRDRTDAVLRMIYVLFTEGYFASSGETVLKLELCQEAIRLAELVASHPGATSTAPVALLALMHLHHARREARTDMEGRPVVLEDQDRSLYKKDELALALKLLTHASVGGLVSKYHVEAAIAAEHAFAPEFSGIRWAEIVRLYERLETWDPSPLNGLHAAIAASYAEGPAAGLARLANATPPTWLVGSHLWLATHADLNARAGNHELARAFYEKAIAIAPPMERETLIALSRRRGA